MVCDWETKPDLSLNRPSVYNQPCHCVCHYEHYVISCVVVVGDSTFAQSGRYQSKLTQRSVLYVSAEDIPMNVMFIALIFD